MNRNLLDTAQLALTLTTAGPWLYLQSRQVRQRVPQLPDCFQAEGQIPGAAPAIRLGFIGDSIMAGIGHQDEAGTLVGHLTRMLAQKSGRTVSWTNLAHNGSCTQNLLSSLPKTLPEVDLWLVSAGVNDALRLRSPSAYVDNLSRLAELEKGVPWLWIGLPNLNDFPCFPYPLRSFLAWRVDQLRAETAHLPAPWHRFDLQTRHTLDTFSPDGFHPGTLGCRIWAEKLLPEVCKILKISDRRLSLRVIAE
ncbi:SGNH/GDSL hydrolase family protein [bacterium]|nr:SGNH/GDSL hydrolase family protein [bacterium]